MPVPPRSSGIWDVIGLGGASLDDMYRLPAIPRLEGPTSKMRISAHARSCGGQMATALSTCASLGLRAKFIGALGGDASGQRILDELVRRGVDVTDAVIRKVPNQSAVILVDDQSGERIVLWDRDDGLALAAGEIDPAIVASGRVVHVDDVDQPAAIRVAQLARAAGLPVTSDIDRMTPQTEKLLAAVSIPILDEHLPCELTGDSDLERAIRAVRQAHHQMICVTQGARGSMLLHGDRLYHESGFQVDAVDTTGAGDVFRGAFIYALLRGDGPAAMLRFANAAAAVSCTRRGAMDSVPRLEEISRLLDLRV